MRLKIPRRKACRFESDPGHQLYENRPQRGPFFMPALGGVWGDFLASQRSDGLDGAARVNESFAFNVGGVRGLLSVEVANV